jgi:hypothetical protein
MSKFAFFKLLKKNELRQTKKPFETPSIKSWWQSFLWTDFMLVTLSLVVISSSVIGCATLSDIQRSSPYLIIDSPYPAEKIANCIVEEGTQVGLNQSRLWSVGWNPLTIKKIKDDYQILVVGIQATPLAELMIKPSDKGCPSR